MPQVPTYNGQQVSSTALQPVMQREIDVSSGLRAAGAALGQVADLADKEVRRQAETEVNRIDSEVTAGWLEWDAANKRKYQGQNADQYAIDAKKWWDDAPGLYAKNTSPLAQQALGAALGRKRTQALGSVFTAVGAEKERFADQSYDAAQNTDIEYAVDIGDYAGTAMKIKSRAAELGKRKGWTTEQVVEEQQKRLGAMHLTAITVMSERNPAGASKYLEDNKGEIPQQAQVRARALIDAELDNQKAKTLAAQNAGKPLAEQLAAGADLSPTVREKYNTEVRNNHAMVQAAQREREAAASDVAWQLVGKGQRVPETTLAQMNGKERVQLQEHLVDRSRVLAAGTSVKTDWPTYIAAREALASEDPAVRKTVNLTALSTKVAPAQMEQLLDLKTKTSDPKKAPEVATSEQQISAAVQALEYKNERAGQYRSAAQDMFNEHLKVKGKEPTYDERREILENLTKEIVLKKREWLPDSTGPAYSAPREVRNAALNPAPAAPKRVATVEEARALPKGTLFIDPQGIERTR
jgi:hypothetical protein